MLGTEAVSAEHQQHLEMKITECTNESKIKEQNERERDLSHQKRRIMSLKNNLTDQLAQKLPVQP